MKPIASGNDVVFRAGRAGSISDDDNDGFEPRFLIDMSDHKTAGFGTPEQIMETTKLMVMKPTVPADHSVEVMHPQDAYECEVANIVRAEVAEGLANGTLVLTDPEKDIRRSTRLGMIHSLFIERISAYRAAKFKNSKQEGDSVNVNKVSLDDDQDDDADASLQLGVRRSKESGGVGAAKYAGPSNTVLDILEIPGLMEDVKRQSRVIVGLQTFSQDIQVKFLAHWVVRLSASTQAPPTGILCVIDRRDRQANSVLPETLEYLCDGPSQVMSFQVEGETSVMNVGVPVMSFDFGVWTFLVFGLTD
jgi:hypothetical protein